MLDKAKALHVTVSCSANMASYELIKNLWDAIEGLGIHLQASDNQSLKAQERLLVETSRDISARSSRSIASLQYDAVMHRLTRHSLPIILDMQHLADHFISVLQHISIVEPLIITIHNWEWADRPSLRVIARIVMLSRARQVPIRWEYQSLSPASSTGHSPWREEFLLNFCRYTGAGTRPASAPPCLPYREISQLQRAIVDMDWDHVLPESAQVEPSLSPSVVVHYAVAFLNAGATQEGYQMISQLEMKADENDVFYGHIAYLKGLIETKRLKQPLEGLKSFRKGLERLSSPEEKEALLAWGWLENGQALAHTMLALESSERDRLLTKIFDDEAALYARLVGSPHRYLRYNVLANMAFLLELMRRYNEAIRFWEVAFQREKFEAINYRVGVLQMKAGNHEAAYISLEQALAVYTEVHNKFYELETLYALAYVGQTLNRPVEQFIARALALSYELGDLNFTQLLTQWKESGMRPERKPDAKQISYVPYAELDCEFGQNFNQYLEVVANHAR